MSIRDSDSSWTQILSSIYGNLSYQMYGVMDHNGNSVEPILANTYDAFKTPMRDIKVIILGEEPYASRNLSTGYAFISKNPTEKTLIELNISNMVLRSDPDNVNKSIDIDMRAWIDQGVLLLNTSLTVLSGVPGSHWEYWQKATEKIVSVISTLHPCIWVMWGPKAKSFIRCIHNPLIVDGHNRESIEGIPSVNDRNYIISGTYPDSDKFKYEDTAYLINRILNKLGKPKIIW